jgi:hypothetical protein
MIESSQATIAKAIEQIRLASIHLEQDMTGTLEPFEVQSMHIKANGVQDAVFFEWDGKNTMRILSAPDIPKEVLDATIKSWIEREYNIPIEHVTYATFN